MSDQKKEGDKIFPQPENLVPSTGVQMFTVPGQHRKEPLHMPGRNPNAVKHKDLKKTGPVAFKTIPQHD